MAFDPVSLAITAALIAAQMALTASQKIEGPRLDSLDVTIADYGTQIPRFWGRKRLEGVPIIWAEKLREKKNTSKTKGGKYTDYKYFGTFAVLIADHEIDSVSRIWLDKHICFDLSGTGPISVSFGSIIMNATNQPVKLVMGRNMRIYLGTETQSPDPRMEAWCEDRYGPDTCPAYRGYSYIVFENIPLEKFGNRIPQVTVEAINQSVNAFPYEAVLTNCDTSSTIKFTDNYSRFLVVDGVNLFVYDTATRTQITESNSPLAGNWGNQMGWGESNIYGTTGFGVSEVVRLGYDGLGGSVLGTVLPDFTNGLSVIEGQVLYYPLLASDNRIVYGTGALPSEINPGFSPTHYFGDGEDAIWATGIVDPGTIVGVYCVIGPRAGFGITFTSPVATSGGTYGVFNEDGNITVVHDDGMFILDPEDLAVLDSATGLPTGFHNHAFRNLQPGSVSVWCGQSEISLTTLAVLRTIDFDNWRADTSAGNPSVYDPVNHAIITMIDAGGELVWRYLDRVGSNGVTLQTVVDDVCGWVNLDGAVTSSLTQIVRGYSVTQGAGKDMIAPLLDIHDVDPRPHDFSVEFKNRGSAVAGTILTTEFVKEETRYEVAIAQDTDIPRRILFNYADTEADQQKNTAVAQRPLDSVDSVREMTIDLTTYVAEPDEAQQYVDRYFRRLWNSRETINHGLTAQRLALEPADVWNVSLDGVVHTARLSKMTIKGLAIDCEWVRDYPQLTTLSGATGAAMEGRDPDAIFIPLQTKGFLLDIPLVRDSDNSVNPIIYVGAGPYGPGGWSGAGVYQGDGTDYETLFATVDSASKTSWGYAATILATANPNLWDRANSFSVQLKTGSLTSSTEAAVNADQSLNLVLLGDELLQFATATLTGARTYTVSGLKRGRRGTEWAVGTHVADEIFVVVQHLAATQMGAGDIGDTLYFKAASIGRTIDEAPEIEVVYDGESHRPLAPCQVSGSRNTATNDWALAGARRTRVGGRWVGRTSIPLGESVESYKFKIMNGASVVRTITDADGFVTYTSAMQVTDFGSNQSTLTFKMLQVGDYMDGRETTVTA